MVIQTQASKYLHVLALAVLIACARGNSEDKPAGRLRTSRLEPISIVSPLPSFSPRWPGFLLVERGTTVLWGGEQGIFRIEMSSRGPAHIESQGAELTRGMDRLIGAARALDGKVAVLDTSGRVAVYSPAAGQTWRFKTRSQNRPGDLAITEDMVYVLLQGEVEKGSAVVAYTFSGEEVGRWGTMPADAIIQTRLRGGGIAACPDGSVYYSYVNTPQIIQLQHDGNKGVRSIGRSSDSFKVVSASRVRQTYREGLRSHSAAPLVKLGLDVSRVMGLLCSEEGLLLRQVAQPARGGAPVEVWDPLSERLVGTIPVGGAVLLDVRDRILYFGTVEPRKFMLDRIQYRVERSRSGKEAD